MLRNRTRLTLASSIALLLIASTGGCRRANDAKPNNTTADAPTTSAKANPKQPANAPTLAVIPKGTTHVFWKAVERGARQAGQDLGAHIIWKGPLTENDRAQQIQLVQQFVSQGVDGIALAPLDFKALAGPVADANAAHIPVVIFDSALDGQPGRDFVSFIATDNHKAGMLGGRHLTRLLEGQGKIVLLRYMVGSASTTNREAGFLEAISESPGLEVILDNRFAGATAGEAKTEALNMIDRIREADGVFCPNESSTLGMLLALRQQGLAGKIRFVGFDASPPLIQALKDGDIDALVVQNPRRMGYNAVSTLIRHLNHKTVEPRQDTGVAVVTRENMNDPDIKPLLE